jgi:hypothetical protein
MSEVLLPCPFCGAPASIRPVARSWWKIVVDHPEACILSGRFDDAIVPQRDEDKAGLVEDWNTRVALATHAGAAAAEPSDAVLLNLWDRVSHMSEMGARRLAFARAVLALTSAPAVPEAGLPLAQEPKYTVNSKHIVNRASGEVIPHDEPVFIFRARDIHAINILAQYAREVSIAEHREAVWARVTDFKAFWDAHPTRMKTPDTAELKGVQPGERGQAS